MSNDNDVWVKRVTTFTISGRKDKFRIGMGSIFVLTGIELEDTYKGVCGIAKRVYSRLRRLSIPIQY